MKKYITILGLLLISYVAQVEGRNPFIDVMQMKWEEVCLMGGNGANDVFSTYKIAPTKYCSCLSHTAMEHFIKETEFGRKVSKPDLTEEELNALLERYLNKDSRVLDSAKYIGESSVNQCLKELGAIK